MEKFAPSVSKLKFLKHFFYLENSFHLHTDQIRLQENFQNYSINYHNNIKIDNINVQEETASLQELDPAIEKQLDMPSYDLLITHWKEDWHQDHRICHDVANTLRRKQPLEVWYMNAFPYCQKYTTFEANVFSDISNHFINKRKAIECYKNVNSRWVDDVEAMSKFRGSFINVEHAEVFKADTILF